jgi:hypothetical protein
MSAMHAKIWPPPAADTLEMAARPFGTSANFQARRRRQVTRPLSSDFRSDETHGRQLRDAAMLELGLATANEVLLASIGREISRIPEAHLIQHAPFVLEGAERRCCAECPITPGTASQTVLEEHADDRHHSRLSFDNTAASFFRFAAGSEEFETLKPKSPFESTVPADWSWDTSQTAL